MSSEERGSEERGQSTWRGDRRGGWRGGRGRGGRGRGRGGRDEGRDAVRQALREVGQQTLAVLPFILKDLPNIKADESELLSLDTLPPLKKEDCPKHSKATVNVINEDTFNAAIMLKDTLASHNSNTSTTQNTTSSRVAILNLASDTSPGGGFERGALAQEEALCYRSSLFLSLHKTHYPFTPLQGLYTRDVVIIRSSMTDGHAVLAPAVASADLPIVSALSIAAIRRPKLADETRLGQTRKVFDDPEDRVLTKKKMRLALRMAASKGHDSVVLGALGCGAFRNPPEEIADAWKEVLEEDEFGGGWWRAVWFAVLDPGNEGNFELFEKVLNGLEV